MGNETEKDDEIRSSKKCPECMTYIPVDAKICPMCKKRVGKVKESGMAKKAVDWKSYIMLVISWGAFFFYMWWAFFRH
jgi:RNA polymerase subunit RPABC4/transcription elongation factor Spt4